MDLMGGGLQLRRDEIACSDWTKLNSVPLVRHPPITFNSPSFSLWLLSTTSSPR